MITKQKVKKLTTPAFYKDVLRKASELDVAKNYTFTKCKSGVYLKMHGVDPIKLRNLFKWVDQTHGTDRTVSHNPTDKKATVTIYDYE